MNSSHRLVITLTGTLLFVSPGLAQQDNAADPQAVLLLQRANAVLARSVAVNDVTLNVRARRIAGADDESGSGVLKGLVSGDSRLDFNFPSGERHEVRSTSAGQSDGNWAGPDGGSHKIAPHNLKVESAWFFPALLLRRWLVNRDKTFHYLGSETADDQKLEHIKVAERNAAIPEKAPPQVSQLIRRLSEMNLYLDSATLLPAKITFSEHPDNDALKDIPVEIHFADYRAVNGVQVPFHLRKFFNGTLVQELDVETVSLNSGLSASAFSLP